MECNSGAVEGERDSAGVRKKKMSARKKRSVVWTHASTLSLQLF